MRPGVAPTSYVGLDGRHDRKPRLNPLGLNTNRGEINGKSPWAKEERLKSTVLPEHTVGPQLKPLNEFERTFATPCAVKFGAKKRLGGLALVEEVIPEPGPGAHEMADAFDAVAATQSKRSLGVPGLRSGQKRFALLPVEKEAAANPAPGAYPPLIKLRKGSRTKPATADAKFGARLLEPMQIAPKNPEFDWQREQRAGRASPTFSTKRSFPLLSDSDRSRVLEATGIKRGFNMPSGPGLYWSEETEADSSKRLGANPYVGKGGKPGNMESQKGTSAFLAPTRSRVGPRAKLQQALRLHGDQPDNHFKLQREMSKWRERGAGRGGFGASYARNTDRFTDWKTGQRQQVRPTDPLSHRLIFPARFLCAFCKPRCPARLSSRLSVLTCNGTVDLSDALSPTVRVLPSAGG